MQSLIAKRNLKFTEAVSELLVACAAHLPLPLDPVALLLEATDEYLPVKPSLEEDGAGGRRERREEMEFYKRNPDKRISIERLIEELKEDEEYYQGQIVEGGHKIVQAREPVFGQLEQELSTSLEDALYLTKKIGKVYSHQAAAINALHRGNPFFSSHPLNAVLIKTGAIKGQNVIVSTSTSSGKTLVYQIPVVQGRAVT